MAKEVFVAIGHISNDINPIPHLGGSVSYGAVTAKQFGLEAHIYTKCRENDPNVDELKNSGTNVHVLSSRKSLITTFENLYDGRGYRKQKITVIQEPITLKDINDNMRNIPKGAIILVAPIVGEIDMEAFITLNEIGKLCIIPQGYFKRINPDSTVEQKKWKGFQQPLLKAKGATTVLSSEDITIDGKEDTFLLNEIIQASSRVALTLGNKGVTVYENGKEACHTGAFSLAENETVDLTGAGDVFATVFIIELTKNDGDIKAASIAACLFAALKIKGITGGVGIRSIPTVQQVHEFVHNESGRVNDYLQSDGVDASAISFLHEK